MAEAQDLDLDVKPARNSKKMLVVIVLLAVVLIGASVGVTIWLVSGDGKDEASDQPAAAAVPAAHYMALENMVVNFAQRGVARYLQVEMQLMAHDPAVFALVEQHMPVIRNDLLVLLSSVSYEQVNHAQGKDELNQAILETINRILQEQAGSEGIQAVYFTHFIMQ